MQNILKRFTRNQLLAVITSLVLAVLFTVMGLSEQQATAASPTVVIEETLADSSMPAPRLPGGGEEQHGWTAWSG